MSKTGHIRTFICVELPKSVTALLAKVQDSLKGIGAEVNWVKPSNIHLTLKFLGDLPEQKLAEICEAVERATHAAIPFEFQVKGTGCFPANGNPRVLWVGIEPVPHPLQELQELIDSGLFAMGIPWETRTFNPHLTIGRVKSARNVQPLVRKMCTLHFAEEVVGVREVTLMRSDLKPAGALYTPIGVFPLAGKAEAN